MKGLQLYDVSFSGLKLGKHSFEFLIEQTFFDLFEVEIDFTNTQVKVELELTKKTTFMEAVFKIKGTVEVICDHSGEEYIQKIKNKMPLLIKFGEEYNDFDDEILILPHAEHQFNCAQDIYEGIRLATPMKRVKPKYKREHTYTQDTSNTPITDPRWEKLNNIKNKLK